MSSFAIETSNSVVIDEVNNTCEFLQEYGKFNMDFKLKQLGKGQDWAIVNTHINDIGEKFAYGVVFDGHGPNSELMQIISSLDINTIMATNSPCETAFKILEKNPIISVNSGSTMNSVKMFAGRIECENMGDSTTIIILNGKIVYQNKCHSYLNDGEKVRLIDKGYSKSGETPVISSNATVIKMEPSPIFVFTNIIPYQLGRETDLTLVPTQSIGHMGVTGCDPDKKCIIFDPLIDEVICLIMSDGITDMVNFKEHYDIDYLMSHNCEEVINMIEARWKQPWMFGGTLTSFPNNGYDDLAFAHLIYKPNNI